eukprot:5636871-Alexandrium_andersonii.AAC.1
MNRVRVFENCGLPYTRLGCAACKAMRRSKPRSLAWSCHSKMVRSSTWYLVASPATSAASSLCG